MFFPTHSVLGAFMLLLRGASARGGLQGSQRDGYGENYSAAVDCHAKPQNGKCFGASLVEVCRRISWLQCGHGAGRAARSSGSEPQPGSTPGPGHLLLKARGWQGKTPSPQRFAHLKKPLQPSQVMALKWKPVALSPQTPQIRGTFLSNSPAGSGSDVLAATVSMSGGAEEGRYLVAAVNSVTKS